MKDEDWGSSPGDSHRGEPMHRWPRQRQGGSFSARLSVHQSAKRTPPGMYPEALNVPLAPATRTVEGPIVRDILPGESCCTDLLRRFTGPGRSARRAGIDSAPEARDGSHLAAHIRLPL